LWPEPGKGSLVLAVLGGFLLLLPRGLPQRWLGLFLILPLFLSPAARLEDDFLRLEVLDVGQGTAALLSTPNHSLLYDSGPGDGEGLDLVRSAIAPAVTHLGANAPDYIVISHGDLDHAGGIRSLTRRYPKADWITSLPRTPGGGFSSFLTRTVPNHEACGPLSRWSWDGILFQAISPSSGLPYRGNDSSCVLSIRSPMASLLLAGDISSAVEKRLVADGLEPHRLLLVPHHGSKTSSSEAFISQVQPEIAIATAGLGNRFGFPRPQIRERYLSMNSKFLSTAECGGIRLRFNADGLIQIESARRARQRIWRWPAANDCP
jgi:competence protein ComEC